MSVEAITLGCRLNFAESESMKTLAPAGEAWTIVNSCAVTAEAVRQTRQAIRRARKSRPDARILVTGCAAQLDPESFEAMPEVDRVVSNSQKLLSPFAPTRAHVEPVEMRAQREAATLRLAQGERMSGGNTGTRAQGERKVSGLIDVKASPTPLVPAGFLSRVRSFVAIQTGCDHRCTFCTIWQARGPSISLPFEAIRDAIAREIDHGAMEIALTGVDITSYEGGLGTLCQRLLTAEPRLKRLRLSSLDSIEIDPALHELIAGEPRLMPHFHLSLQAGDDMILKRMKRRHSRLDAVRTIERIKAARPDATIGADLIAGFPTETEEMSINSLELLDDCDIIAAHIFPFSPRPNTPAARMPQLEREIVKARATRLRGAAAGRRAAAPPGCRASSAPPSRC
jgi:threonylcarbamoyladenosine tRNA methylthiotransferase MtaB